MNTNNRLLSLDNLKVCLTLLVIFHHAGQAYGDGGDWAYQPSNPAEYMPWIWHFFSVNAAFFMGLFFLISGYFVPTSFDRQGAKVFVQKKLIRLGIPLWDSKFWQWCAAQSYGAYIFHLLLMIVLQYATDGIWMGAFGKFMFIGIITTICSFVLTWLVRLIPGAKKVL